MTAVEWLQETLSLTFEQQMQFEGLFQQAKEMEEQDLKNAFLDGWQLRDGDLPFPKAKNKWFEEFKNK